MEEKRSESKSKLNESTLPLLDDSECVEAKQKSEIEMKFVEKEDPSEKEAEIGQVDGKEGDRDDKKKDKSHRRTISCAAMTAGLNLLDRDEKHVNDEVNLVFEDILAESDAAHSFSGSWKASYIVFSRTKRWFYRLLTAVISIPLALFWGLLFSVLILVHVWLFTPLLKAIDLSWRPFRKVWSGVVHLVLDPLFESIGLMFAAFRRSPAMEP